MILFQAIGKKLNKVPLVLTSLVVGVVMVLPAQASALSFHANHVIDDSVFDRKTSMSASSIDSWLNRSFGSTSCISTSHGFTAHDPTGYSPSGGYTFGGYVSAGRVIYDAAQATTLILRFCLLPFKKNKV